MVKRFSYLVSVSVLASSLLSTASHAVYEDELRDVINDFRVLQRSQPIQQAVVSLSSEEEPYSYWNAIGSATSSFFSPIVSGTGHSLRYLGDALRGETFVGDLLESNVISLAGKAQYGGISAVGLIEQVQADKGALQSLRKTSGNVLRSIGASMVGETPTLERAIRHFWIEKRMSAEPEEVLISTACALYRSQEIGGADEIKLVYHKFIEAWNGSSYTAPSDSPEHNVEYFLKGIIRGFVMNGQNVSDFEVIAPQMVALGITYENLPVTKAITAEAVVPNVQERGQLVPANLQKKINEARQTEFMKFVKGTYQVEILKQQADQARMVSLQAPIVLPSAFQAIEDKKPSDDLASSVD
ncbi:MAG: hypothetical protein K2P93_07930 [Alphaproteobacteria bacterium]|nr:hypothetical protein [Alphaproteobacteria bacterium]